MFFVRYADIKFLNQTLKIDKVKIMLHFVIAAAILESITDAWPIKSDVLLGAKIFGFVLDA